MELGFIHRYLPPADPSSGTTLLLLHGTGVCMIVGLVMTLVYIYPINDILFIKAGGDLAPEKVRSMARQWIIADRLRFGIMTIGFISLLRALSLPFATVLKR